MSLLITLLYLVFVFSAIVLIVVVLLQEGRGGGFGSALGESGQQTFGVGAKGINQFTGYTATVFLVSAILIHIFTLRQETGTVLPDASIAPIEAGEPVVPGENR
ncbi:MAG: preprotein translocase subunit SecG [Planctomycetota bacterium]